MVVNTNSKIFWRTKLEPPDQTVILCITIDLTEERESCLIGFQLSINP